MEAEQYSFQPQINTRSRRLARHAPTLRERQEQQERLRNSTSRERSDSGHAREAPAAATLPRTPQRAASARREQDAGDDDAVQSVRQLWRAVAAGEGRDEERAFVRTAGSSVEASAPQRPPVVHVSTVLAMLRALGISGPQHTAVIDKFMNALHTSAAAGKDDAVEAERFAYVFARVWRAAVTNTARWSPAPARAAAAPRSASRSSPPSEHATLVESTSACSSVSLDDADERSEAESAGSCVDRGDSATSSPSSVHESGGDGTESSEDGSFLHTNLSSEASPPQALPSASSPACEAASRSPLSEQEAAGLSLSPEPRKPQPTPTAGSSTATRGHRSPFAATSAPLRSLSSSSSMRRQQRRSASMLRVLAADSHLLTSTASCERKKAAKRAPGGLMRECTFAPQINRPTDERRRRQAPSESGAAGAPPSPMQSRGERTHAAPLAPGFDAAVKRMIAARRQQQQQQQVAAPLPARREPRRAPEPLLYVDVDLPGGATGRLTLCRGADVSVVASEFGEQHGLDERLRQRLEAALRQQLAAFA